MRALDPRLTQRVRAVRALLAADVALGVVAVVPVIAQAVLLARIVAGAFEGERVGELAPALVALVLAFCARGAIAWAMEVTGRRAAASALSELRLSLVRRRLAAQPVAADGVQAAEVAAVAVQGIDGLEAWFARYLPQLVLAGIVPLAVVAAVTVTDPLSGAVLALTLPLVPVFMWLLGRAAHARSLERFDALRRLEGDFLDTVRGLPTLRALNRGREQAGRIATVGDAYRRATMGTLRLAFLSGSVLELAATLGVALVAVTVGVRLAGGELALQPAVTVLVLAPEVYLPLRRLGAEHHASADGLAVARRLLDLLDAPAVAPAGGRRSAPSPAVAPVRLERVSFAYPARPALVLDGLDLTLEPGETVALVGESGAGKSTAGLLLLGLLSPSTGRVVAGDVDLAGCDLDAWRRAIAWVPQRPALLRASLADNIRLGDTAAPASAVRRAAARAGADSVAARLPDGYATVLGDGGRTLSPGERRRVALARAVLRDAPLVVLDEPTADLDGASAAVVARAVTELCAQRTVLLITHDDALAAAADRVVRLGAEPALAVAA